MMLQVKTGLLLHKLNAVNGSINCSYFYRSADAALLAEEDVPFMPHKRDRNMMTMNVLPVLNKRREVFAGKPQRVTNSQNPQDGQLIQHLAHKTQSHVEIHGENT